MSLGVLVFLVLLVAKVFGFATFGWFVVFLPLVIEIIVDGILLVLFGTGIFKLFKWAKREISERPTFGPDSW